MRSSKSYLVWSLGISFWQLVLYSICLLPLFSASLFNNRVAILKILILYNIFDNFFICGLYCQSNEELDIFDNTEIILEHGLSDIQQNEWQCIYVKKPQPTNGKEFKSSPSKIKLTKTSEVRCDVTSNLITSRGGSLKFSIWISDHNYYWFYKSQSNYYPLCY